MSINRMRELAGLPALENTTPTIVVEETDVTGYTAVVVVSEDGTMTTPDGTEIQVSETVEAEEVVVAEEVAIDSAVEISEAEDKEPELEEDKATKAPKVPAEITAAIRERIAELKDAMARYDKKGYNDESLKQTAIDALNQISDNLKQEDGIAKAHMYFGKLMSPVQDLLPPKVVKFLHSK